ncbi:MAG TPA: Ig-like domain-containing protein [Croceibacterium sp.]|nr:Ig-like domain-containing protein [Croceibacterium sp.]
MAGWEEIIKGTKGDDIIDGGTGDDYLQGKAGDDILRGHEGNDLLHGDGDDDYLVGGAGDDTLDGGTGGIDYAVFSGSVKDYTFTSQGGNYYISHTGGTQADGTDWLIHIERLMFSDATIDLTQNNAPIAYDDSASTDEDAGVYSSGSTSVLDNDFDWEGDSLSVTAGTIAGAYGTLNLNSDGTYTYTPTAAAQALAEGETVQDSFTYTVSDGSLSDTGTLTINVSGNNDAPVAVADTATTGENSSVTIDVLANDSDIDNGATLTVTAASVAGGQGSVAIVGNQLEFDPGTDFDHLAEGASVDVVISYTIADEHGASASSTATVTVTGTNDGPVANADTASTTENAAVLVDVLANDNDADDGAVLTVVAASAPSGQGSASIVGNQVQFDPGSDFDHLADGATANVTVSYTIEDEHGASASSTIQITVTGTNDGPVANPDTDTTSENAAVTVDVLANDTDADDGAVLTVTAASGPSGQGSVAIVGNQVEFDPGTDFDYLAVGESADVVINYTIEDEHGASSSSTATVTVTGANDAPTIDAANTTASGSVEELPNGDPGEGTATHSADGTIAFDDLDLSDTHSASATAQGSGYLGTFTLDPVDQTGDSVGWSFDVSDADLDSLDEGEEVTQTYTVEIDDGKGGTATQDVTITITGAGDSVPPDGTNWYIDNSAVGSAETGSPSDPFTSIAAFNAAQGTPGGPGAGDNVFLLAGTGTYAEADGINLLDGQTLTGVADGALRPTIAATAGDGIDVAENNTVAGVDVVSAGGAGIDDNGGTVGTLTVTDVGISGAGQIVDIDNGGTLAVTLNSAASTGSSGGAIDLDGLGGSFAVSGATTIAGAQSGGAVDVTGGTLSTAFQGGLTIANTSGFGLNVQNSGSIAVSAGSIATVGATAVNLTNVTSGGVTLASVSANGGVNGILLSGTGSSAGFTVTGTGVAGSGGTIQGTTGAAIVATDTMDLDLSSMSILNTNGQAILATDLRGENSLTDSTISGFGLGSGNTVDGVRIVNTDTDMTSFTVTGTTFSNGATGNDAIFMQAFGTSSMGLRVEGSTFTGLAGDGIQVNGASGSTGDVDVHVVDSDFLNAAAGGNGGVTLNSLGTMTMRAAVEGGTFDDIMRPNTNLGAVSMTNGGGATAHFTIQDNVIEDLLGARAITFTGDGTSSTFVLVDGNSIDRLGTTSKIGINANFNASATGDVTISDNFVGQNGNLWTAGNGNANAILVNGQNSTSVDVLIDGNLVTANSNLEVVRVRSINSAVMNATVTDNNIRDTAGADLEFDASAGLATGTATLNLDIFGNLFSEADADVIRLNDAAGGVLNVVQASAADVSTLNDAATVTQLGVIFYGAPPPPLPLNPDLPLI